MRTTSNFSSPVGDLVIGAQFCRDIELGLAFEFTTALESTEAMERLFAMSLRIRAFSSCLRELSRYVDKEYFEP